MNFRKTTFDFVQLHWANWKEPDEQIRAVFTSNTGPHTDRYGNRTLHSLHHLLTSHVDRDLLNAVRSIALRFTNEGKRFWICFCLKFKFTRFI